MNIAYWHFNTGDTLKLELYPLTAGAIANGEGGDDFAETDAVNRPGYYVAEVTEPLSGLHHAKVMLGGFEIASAFVQLGEASLIVLGNGLNSLSGLPVQLDPTGVSQVEEAASPTVNVMPFTAQQQAQSDGTTLYQKVKSLRPITIYSARDANGALIDWTTIGTCTLYVTRRTSRGVETLLQTAAGVGSELTASGDDNEHLTWTPNADVVAAVTSSEAPLYWSVRVTELGADPIIDGKLVIGYSAGPVV